MNNREKSAGCRLLLICLAGVWAGLPAFAAPPSPLSADELLLLYNPGDPASRQLAEYYAQARHVPAGRLLPLAVGNPGEQIPELKFEQQMRLPVRAFLAKSGLQKQVRCLVTFYGLPIRVAQMETTPARARLLERWRREFQTELDELRKVTGELNPTATQSGPAASKPGARPPEPEEQLLEAKQNYRQAAQAFLDRLKSEPPANSQGQMRTLFEAIQKVDGLAGVLTQVNFTSSQPGLNSEQLRAQFAQQLKDKQAQIRTLLTRPADDASREEARRRMREVNGVSGVMESLLMDINHARVDQTYASVDSELALLWWNQYSKYRWVNNPDSWRFRADLVAEHQAVEPHPPVLMVSRIDGPSAIIARGLIDKAIAAEKEGPSGKVYVDARGIPEDPAYGQYDAYLRKMADLISRQTSLPVVLDNKGPLFQAGQCPEALLYCGWYSVGRYVDAFDFVPGAVGYHIASFEAASLRGRQATGWCPGMLNDGITATLGPVAEPYLHSFPRPDHFFGLLLTGRFTLAEVYHNTIPHYSWLQMLMGDPLYRPFGAHPALPLEKAVPPELIPPEYRQAGAATRPG